MMGLLTPAKNQHYLYSKSVTICKSWPEQVIYILIINKILLLTIYEWLEFETPGTS